MGGNISFFAAKEPEVLHAEPRHRLFWKGSFDENVCKYPTTGEGLACALACHDGSDGISAQYLGLRGESVVFHSMGVIPGEE